MLNLPLDSPLTKNQLKFKGFFAEARKYLPSFKVINAVKKTPLFVLIANPKNFKDALSEFDKKHKTSILKALEASSFTGKEGETFLTYTMNNEIRQICLIIFDEKDEHDVRAVQELGAKISCLSNSAGVETVSVQFNISHKETEHFIKDVYYGVALRNYRFDKYFEAKKEGKAAKLKCVEIVSEQGKSLPKLLEEVSEVASHVMLVRDLVNTPALDLNPKTYSSLISEGFEDTSVKVKVLDEKEMQKLGMNALLAVGHGSVNRPTSVIMEYMGNPSSKEVDFAIIGKGVCFDSGGYSIKPANSMEDMKCDMAGSAVAFAVIRLAAQMKLKSNVIACVGLVENLVNHAAYKPGDVLRSMSGQTIEVLNTDAEGRLVLADLLYYAQKKYQPKYMVDLATLTGAVTVALGDIYAGLMFNDEDIASKIEDTGKETGELSWKLPFRKEYDKMIDSSIADMKNIGSARGAGTITAGQFLKRFVNCEKTFKTKWAHLDIAGVAFDGKGGADPKVSKGGTGWGVYLLHKVIKTYFSK